MSGRNRIQLAALLLLSLGMTACAPKDFSKNEGESAVAVKGTDDDNAANGEGVGDGGGSEVPATGTGSNGTNPDGSLIYPEIKIQIPSNCVSNAVCTVRPALVKADSKQVSFQWATQDTAYTTNPGVIGQPNVHYVPTSGQVIFNAGELEKTMPIQALDQFTTILIPFKWWNCRYNGTPINCNVMKFSIVRM